MANSNNPGGKFYPPSSREHALAARGATVGGVHSAGQVVKPTGGKPSAAKAAKPSPAFKNISH
jgi:hypothetical protein